MIEESIVQEHESKLKKELEEFVFKLELEREKLSSQLEQERKEILKNYEKELIEQNESSIRALKNELERDLNQRKREFIDRLVQKLLIHMNNKYKQELMDIIAKLDYEEIIVPENIDIPGAKKSKELLFGFIYKPRGKNYYINMDMRRIIEKYITNIIDQL
ncbi:MAG: hypothetical protein QXE47_01215 [Candidatus Anstonellales archaeon]